VAAVEVMEPVAVVVAQADQVLLSFVIRMHSQKLQVQLAAQPLQFLVVTEYIHSQVLELLLFN
jgi:hypothetical protein